MKIFKHTNSVKKEYIIGKLYFMDWTSIVHEENSDFDIFSNNMSRTPDGRYIKPFFISDTEKIEIGDWFIPFGDIIIQPTQMTSDYTQSPPLEHNKKILVLPEYFSDNHLRRIIDGNLIENEMYLIEVDSDRKIKLNPHIIIAEI